MAATSKFNQFLEDVDENVLECAICFKRLQNPKSLNCLHSFCLACLEDWVKKKGKQLTCPTCSKSYPIPEGGLQKLPPNTFLNNLLEKLEQYDERDQIMKCICGKTEENYCQDCRHYLCSSCSDYHKLLPMSANHKLHTVEEVRSMTTQDFALLNPPLCSLHSKPLELYCQDCKTPICMHCTFINHKVWEGQHKPISISDAFQTFKKKSATLQEVAHHYENKLQDGLKAVIQISAKLEEGRQKSLQDIDSLVHKMIETIMKKGDEMKNNVEINYKQKKKVNDLQMNELKTIISEVNTKLSFLKHLLKSDEATAMQSSETVIKALEVRVSKMPKTEPDDNGHIFFSANQHYIASLQQYDIGNITQSMTDGLSLMGVESVTQGQIIVAKIIKADTYIDASQLKVKWTHPTRETNITQVDEDDDGCYVVTGKCTSPGVCRLDVSVDGEPIKQSPMIVNVEKEGLVNTIKLDKNMIYYDLVKCEDESLLVSCMTNKMYKYKQSGEYIGKITLPQGVNIFRMYRMNNGKIAVSDDSNKCIKIVKMINSKVIKSIGQGVLGDPAKIHVDKTSNVVYVADYANECVSMFDFDSGKMIRKIMLPGNTAGDINITLTNQGHILALVGDPTESYNNRLLQYDSEGRFIRVLVKGDEYDSLDFQGVVVDEDDNIIVLSAQKLQLFSNNGDFIKRIDKPENGITNPGGVCLISQHPRRVAVANDGDKTIKIYNY